MTTDTLNLTIAQEMTFSSVFDALPGNSYLVKNDVPRFTILAATSGILKLSGLNKEDIIGKGLFEIFPSNPRNSNDTGEANLSASFMQVLNYKKEHQLPVQRYDVVDESGMFIERYWRVENRPVIGPDGEVVYIIHTTEDITSQMKAEHRELQLDGIETAFGLFMHAPMVVGLVTGKDHVLEMANEEALKLWGKGSDIIGKPLLQVLPELKEQGIIELFDQVRHSGKPYLANEVPVRSFAGGQEKIHFFNLVYQPYFGKGNSTPTGVFTISHDVTEQVMAIKAAQESEAKYRGLFDSMDQGFCVLEMIFNDDNLPVDYRFLEANPVFEKQTGLKDAIGKTAKQLVPDLEPYWFELYGKVALTGESIRFTEGSQAMGRWFEVYAFRTGGNGSRKVALLFSDISERKKAEEAEEKARLAVASAELGTFEVNLVTNELIASERMKFIFGVDTVTDRERYISAIHPDDKVIRSRAYETAFQNGLLEYEARLIQKNGTVRWIRVKGRVYFDMQSQPVKLMGVVQDITEEKEFAEELHKQVDQQTAELLKAHQDLLDTSTYFQHIINKFEAALVALVPVFDGDRIVDFSFKMANEAFTKYGNLPPSEIRGKRISDIFPEYYKTDAFEKYVEVYRTGKQQTWELHYNVDKLNLFLVVNASKMNDEVVVDLTNITELKNLQLKLMQNVHELEQSNHNLEEFAYAASHDLKEPVRKIHFFSERLKGCVGDRLTEVEHQYFQRMELAAKRMSSLIDDLLAYSEVSQKSTLREEADLNLIIDGVLSDLDLEIEQKAASIQVSPLFTLKGHRRQLQQAFQNLISNALKYAKPGFPPQISIQCNKVHGKDTPFLLSAAGQNKEYYRVTVKDNGIGFDQADAERIFNVFTRLHGNKEYKGTGVGLSIVKKVIENHGGCIMAESIPNEGSSFTIFLPGETDHEKVD